MNPRTAGKRNRTPHQVVLTIGVVFAKEEDRKDEKTRKRSIKISFQNCLFLFCFV